MRKILLLLMFSLFVTACNSDTDSHIGRNSHTIIDWIDFVKIDDTEYHAIYTGIIADPQYIGEEISQVKFKVDENVTNSSYRIKNGDAAFWEEGTKIYSVKTMPDFIAIQDNREINNYRIYQSQINSDRYQWHYKDINQEKIKKIEIYEGYNHSELLVSMLDEQKIDSFMEILNSSETKTSFHPNISQGDPDMYDIVFYTDQQFAYKYQVLFDGNVWYWHPWDTSILPDEIADYILN